jgi:hypothetical protein
VLVPWKKYMLVLVMHKLILLLKERGDEAEQMIKG